MHHDIVLLSALKNYLDITWEDRSGDLKLSAILERGVKYLNKTAGRELNFAVEDKPRELLFDYVRYVISDGLHEFQTNYLHELLSLQFENEIISEAEGSSDE